MAEADLTKLTNYNISDSQKTEIVDGLLKCAAMNDPSRRNTVVGQLDSQITMYISRHNATSIDVFNIVTTCLQFEGGLAKLIAVVRYFEGDSISFRALNVILLRISKSLKADVREHPDVADARPLTPITQTEDRAGKVGKKQVNRSESEPGSPDQLKRLLKVFLSHSSEDKQAVRDLYQRLIDVGVEPWLDEEDLLPGQKWQEEIPKAVRKSDAIIVCVSQALTSKVGYIQKEINLALDIAEEQPEGTIFVIPVRLEECEVPSRLSSLTWVDLFEPRGFERLIRSLRSRAAALGADLGVSAVPPRRKE